MQHNELTYTVLEDGTRKLTTDYIVSGYEHTYIVPTGFITDGASIPRFLWRLCGHPFDVPRIYAAVVHDYLYATASVSRQEADELYYEMLRALGVSWFKAKAEYYAIRMFGGSHYNKGEGQMKNTSVKDVVAITMAMLMWAFLTVFLFVVTGCATKTRSVEVDGMFLTETGTLAIGSVEVVAAPIGEETTTIKYAEDTAWLSPSTKTHEIKVILTGTNSVNAATKIVASICNAFVAVGTGTNNVSQTGKEN